MRRLRLPGSVGLHQAARRYLRWFYGQARVVYAGGADAAREAAALGLRGPDVRPLPGARRWPVGAAAV